MITDNEANTVYVSSLLKTDFPQVYADLTALLNKHKVAYDLIPCTKDIWCRDYMPLQLERDRFLNYRYRPDYLINDDDARPYITDNRLVCKQMDLKVKNTQLTIDGGNVVKVGNKVIMTEKVFAENADVPQNILEKRLQRIFECEIIFLPWDKHEKYGHADGIVKPINDRTVLLTNYDQYDKAYYEKFYWQLYKAFEIETLHYDVPHPHRDNWAYINFLTVGNLIVVPRLMTEEDEQALAQIKKHYPGYYIEQLDIRPVLALGGGLNCITWCKQNDAETVEFLKLLHRCGIPEDARFTDSQVRFMARHNLCRFADYYPDIAEYYMSFLDD